MAKDLTTTLDPRRAEGPNLAVPVVLLLMVSTVMMAVLTFVAARSLDRSAESAARQLAETLLTEARRDIAKLAQEASQLDTVRSFAAGAHDRDWAERQIGQRLRRVFGISSLWLLDGQDRTLYGQIGDTPGTADAPVPMPAGLAPLLANARRAPDGAHGLVLLNGGLHVAAAVAVPEGAADPAAAGAPVLVLTNALDRKYLRLLEGVHFVSGAALSGEAGEARGPAVRLPAPNGQTLGYLVLDLAAPGTALLHQVWPAVASAFASMLLLVGLFVRRMERARRQRVRLEETLERERELRQIKARFVNMVSHEIRTPLTTIRAATDLLARYSQQMSPEERESELKAIQREVDVLSALVEDVLAIGRTEGDGFVLQPRPLDLEAMAREVWAVLERAYAGGHSLALTAPPEARNVALDVSLLRPVLSNLLGNAIKFSPEADRVELRIEVDEREVRFSVADRGIGIPPEQIEAVLQPFNRASNVGAISGSGLGLTIAQQAVERHGGRMAIESELDRGTTVTVRLPRPPGEGAAAAPASPLRRAS